jgi:glycine cleavage system H protein
MTEFLSFTIDKFTFKIATDRFYNDEGVWAKLENKLVRVGISDYVQQRSGDVAFAEVKPAGERIELGDEIAVIETIKVNISLSSPVHGKVVEANPALESAPEVINQDPYEAGWLVSIEPEDWQVDGKKLLTAQAYYSRVKGEAEQETRQE